MLHPGLPFFVSKWTSVMLFRNCKTASRPNSLVTDLNHVQNVWSRIIEIILQTDDEDARRPVVDLTVNITFLLGLNAIQTRESIACLYVWVVRLVSRFSAFVVETASPSISRDLTSYIVAIYRMKSVCCRSFRVLFEIGIADWMRRVKDLKVSKCFRNSHCLYRSSHWLFVLVSLGTLFTVVNRSMVR